MGEGGSGKTFTMLDCAVSVAAGAENWLGYRVAQSPVLIIDEENGPRRLARRLGEVLRGHFANELTPVHYVTLAQFDFRNADDVNALQVLIEKTGARLVIIDLLVDIMPGADENAVKDVQPVFLALRKVATVTHSAIGLIYHANKAGGYRGSTALKGAVDLMLMVDKKADLPNIDLRSEKARDTEPFNFAAAMHFQDGRVWLTTRTQRRRSRFTRKRKGM